MNNAIKGKLMESEMLVQQASHNGKEQFSNSPTLDRLNRPGFTGG